VAHTYVSNLIHCVFSTKERRETIHVDWRAQLWPYIGGIARKNGFQALAVGGTGDHLHALLSLPSTLSIAKALQLIKGGSSKWIHDSCRARLFGWQDGYAAFSVSRSNLKATAEYVERQAEHHKRRTFEQEYLALLRKHGMPIDEFTFG
jgi:REP element-mobilizing transposase RayT